MAAVGDFVALREVRIEKDKFLRLYLAKRGQSQWIVPSFSTLLWPDCNRYANLVRNFQTGLESAHEWHKRIWPGIKVPELLKSRLKQPQLPDDSGTQNLFAERTIPTSQLLSTVVGLEEG